MRIAYISNSIIPSKYANSVQVMKMCQAFTDNGHEVTLLARFGWDFGQNCYKQYSVRPCFDIVKYWRPKIFSKRVRYAIYTSLLRYRMKNIKKTPDLLYGRDVSGLLALRDLSIPTIYEAHGSPRGKDMLVSENELFQNANFCRLVVTSDLLKQEYLELFPELSAGKIVVANNGADIPATAQKIHSNVTAGSKIGQVGYVGHLYSRKGMDIIAELIPRMPDIQFHIIGGMPEDLKKWTSKLEKYKNVRFYGFISQENLAELYLQFDIVLAPYTHAEKNMWTSPLKIFEYMAYEKTMIASDIPAVKEVLVDGENALLAAPDNIDQWVKCIRQVVKDGDLQKKLASKAHQDLVTTYSWKSRAQRVIEGI